MVSIRDLHNNAVGKQGGLALIKVGQIAPGKDSENAIVENFPEGKYSKDPAEKGQYRPAYKVFICDEHNEGTPVAQLPWAVMGGYCGLRNESNGFISLPPNTYVALSIKKDNSQGQPYYEIVEVLPNYSVNLDGSKSEAFCKPGSGFVPGSNQYYVPQDALLPDGSGIAPGCEANISVPNLADEKQSRDGKVSAVFAQPVECVPVDTARINKDLEKLIKEIEDLRTGLLGDDSFLATSQDFIDNINAKISEYSEFLTDGLAWLIQYINEQATRAVNTIVNNTIGNLYLSARYAVLEANDNALDLMSCLFLQILSNLADIVADFLSSFIDEYLNTGICVIESFLSTLLGNILAQIQGALAEILGPLSSLLGSAIDLVDSILGFAESILDFLTCDIEQLCPVTNEWNFLEGGLDSKDFTDLDFESIFDSAKAFADDLIALGDIPSGLADTTFDFGIDDALDAARDCIDSSLVSCGPPEVVFWGADGSGTTADAVISAAGEILGVNIITPGTDYSYEPTVTLEDSCGSGVGADATAVIGEYEYTDPETGETSIQTGVIDVIINNTGYGYLPAPDGSVGGMGRTIANKCQSLIRRANNTWDGPYNSGDIIEIGIGDLVILAGQPEYISEENTTVTAPPCPEDGPATSVSTTSASTTYPVVIEIGDVNVANPGFGFQDGDTITVTPDNGAVLEPVITNGSITGVNIINPGIGFDEMPELSVNTNTGYNAILNPVLSFKRVDDNVAFNIPAGTKLVSVVDCVGKN
jgi:hypothetical protein